MDTVRPLRLFAALSVLAAGLVVLLLPSHSAVFRPYFGGIAPPLAVASVIAVGGLSLGPLQKRGFEVLRVGATGRGIAVSVLLATFFAIVAIVADILLRFPEEMNVPLPQALAFYPAIAYVVEVVFHALPLALLLVGLGPLRGKLGTERFLRLCIVVTALLEPTFQLVMGGDSFLWLGAFVWVHVFLINLAQLMVFRRFDLVSMYSLRLVYYLYWHIAWGYIRLQVLF